EAGQQRAPLGRPALGVDLAPKLAQVEEHPFVRVADDALAHLAPSDLELLAPSRPGPAHAQGGDPVRRERIVLRDGIDGAQGSVLGVTGRAVEVEGEGREVALAGAALVAFSAGALGPEPPRPRDLRQVPGELPRLRGVVAELDPGGFGRSGAQDGELGMAGEAAK